MGQVAGPWAHRGNPGLMMGEVRQWCGVGKWAHVPRAHCPEVVLPVCVLRAKRPH